MHACSDVRVLLVGGDEDLDAKLSPAFDARGWHLVDLEWKPETADLVQREAADVLLLAIQQCAANAFKVARWVRSFSDLPVVFLSRRNDESLIVRAFSSGGDDFVCEPFSIDELIARVTVKLKQARRAREQDFTASERMDPSRMLKFELTGRYVISNGVKTQLTPTEFRFLTLFARHPGRVLSYGFVLETVWGDQHRDAAGLVHSYVSRLRRKLGESHGQVSHFTSIPGAGYIFNGVAWFTTGEKKQPS